MSTSARPSGQGSTDGVAPFPESNAELGLTTLLYTREAIDHEVKRLAGEISRDYQGLDPLLIGVLNGVFVFMADLVRVIDIPVEVDFIRTWSYLSTSSTGDVQVSGAEHLSVEGRHVILVDDIVDTGQTTTCIMELLHQGRPESIRVCALLDKPSRRTVDVNINYLGLAITDKFVVGYGLDLDQRYRNLPDIYTVETS